MHTRVSVEAKSSRGERLNSNSTAAAISNSKSNQHNGMQRREADRARDDATTQQTKVEWLVTRRQHTQRGREGEWQ